MTRRGRFAACYVGDVIMANRVAFFAERERGQLRGNAVISWRGNLREAPVCRTLEITVSPEAAQIHTLVGAARQQTTIH